MVGAGKAAAPPEGGGGSVHSNVIEMFDMDIGVSLATEELFMTVAVRALLSS